MNRSVKIASDSTCDLSPALLEQYSITINPLNVTMDDQSYKDGLEVSPEELYAYVKQSGKLPKTSAPNIADYEALFQQFINNGQEVVHFTISSQMSSSYQNAKMAAEELDGVYVIDSQTLSTGIGLLVLKAAELAAEGRSAKEIYEEINELRDKVDTSFVIDTLEFLHKGGRCSSVAKLGANLLQLKPCIEVKEGVMSVGKKYRGKIIDVVPQYIAQRLADPSDIDTHRIFITHSGCSKEMEERAIAKVKELMQFDEVLLTKAGCTVSTHCGPNTLGVLFIRKTPIVK